MKKPDEIDNSDRTEKEANSQSNETNLVPAKLDEIAEAVSEVSEEQRQFQRKVIQSQSLTISPTLPPEYLEAYEEMCPGAGRTILLSSHELAKREQEADLELRRREQSLREKESENSDKRASRAQVFAFVLSTVAIVGGIVLLALGKEIAGLGAIITPVAGLVVAFIANRTIGRGMNKKDPNSQDLSQELIEDIVQKVAHNMSEANG